MRFDLVDLQLVQHVFDAGSITGGAARACLTLAAASERLRGLEGRVGGPLFERHSRGVRPTARGAVFVREARAVLEACARLEAALPAAVRVPLRLWANTAACAEHLPSLLEVFLSRHPDDAVDVVEAPSEDIGDALRDGRCDLGIAADWSDLHGLDVSPFRDDALVLVTAPGDPLAARDAVHLGEVANRSFVGLPAGSVLQRHVESRARRDGIVLVPRVRAPGFEAACRMATAGVGLAVVPAEAARRFGATWVPLDHAWSRRRLKVCSRPGTLPAPVLRLREHLRGVSSPRR